MLNVISMDLYRLCKSKIIWGMLLVVGIISIISLNTLHNESEYFQNLTVETLMSEGSNREKAEELIAYYQSQPIFTKDYQYDVMDLYSRLLQSSLIGICLVVFTVIFVGAENNSGFIKNIAGQTSIRHRTILSKCVY